MLRQIVQTSVLKIAQVSQFVVICVTRPATIVIVASCLTGASLLVAQGPTTLASRQILDRDKLIAWCIVPFDANKRGPAARAQMVMNLGLKRVAYDWREEHVPTFEQEIVEYKKRGIEFFAFWAWHPSMATLVEKYEIRPQFWLMLSAPNGETDSERVMNAVESILPRVQQVAELGCKVGIYNHGGWAGEPGNMVAVCEAVRKRGFDNVGIVYNFHHGHDHVSEFASHIKLMLPHLLCVNVNGMNDNAEPKILPIGSGQHESAMLRTILESGYDGPIGILDHRSELDSAESLRLNLNGLDRIRQQLNGE